MRRCQITTLPPLQVSDIFFIEWATAQSLGLGNHEHHPFLLLHTSDASNGGNGGAAQFPDASTPANAAGATVAKAAEAAGDGTGRQGTTPATPATAAACGSLRQYAIRIEEPPAPEQEEEEEEQEGGSSGAAGGSSGAEGPPGTGAGSAAGVGEGQQPAGASLSEQARQLGRLEYVLRLCMLEEAEQRLPHELPDEQIRLAFGASAGGEAAALAAAIAGASPTQGAASAPRAGASNVDALTTDLGRQLRFTPQAPVTTGGGGGRGRRTPSTRGFGSPV